MNPVVCRVRPLNPHRLLLDFTNGEQKVFDLAPYLSQGVFRELRDLNRFAAARVVAGSVEWPGAIDLSYDTLYLGSFPYEPASADA
ncbi:MAG TPA: DUF2442 domain-containing protein [Steroidobacteraceae bacterium]|nr:DUF2442 domain-containing protein [Steroidobacteraceae bacterium]